MFRKQFSLNDARRQGSADAENDLYAPDRFLDSRGLLSPAEFHDPVDLAMRKGQLTTRTLELTARQEQTRDALVEGPPRRSRSVGAFLLFLVEWGALFALFLRELGMSVPEAFCFASLLTAGSFYLTHLLRKYLRGNDRRWWAYALVVAYAVFAVALTYLRTAARDSTDGPMTYNLVIGIILAFATLLPSWLGDGLYAQVAATTPMARQHQEITIRLEETQAEIEESAAVQRSIKEHEAYIKQLRAAYDTSHDATRAKLGKPLMTSKAFASAIMIKPLTHAVILCAVLNLIAPLLRGPGFVLVLTAIAPLAYTLFSASAAASLHQAKELALAIFVIAALAAYGEGIQELARLTVPVGLGVILGNSLRGLFPKQARSRDDGPAAH